MNQEMEKNCAADRERLFFQLFMAHQRIFYAYILSAVHNYSDADDIVQETATVMWRRFAEFTPGSNFRAWGVTIARNQILRFFNSHKRSRLQFDDELLKQLEMSTLQESAHLDHLGEALRKCFQRLSEANRKILDLRYKDHMAIKSIANMMGKPVYGMYKAFSRLQDSLQRCMETTLREEQA